MTYKASSRVRPIVGTKIMLLQLFLMKLSPSNHFRVSFLPRDITPEHLSAWMENHKDRDFPRPWMRPNKIGQLIKMTAS